MKDHIISDFIVNHAMVEVPQNYVELESWRLYFDGPRHKNETEVVILVISPKGIPKSLNKIQDFFKTMRLNMKP